MGLEEIDRLKEKIDKDPNSKLFVPLAEEYKKLGMYDEAIDALTKGLERQPTYLSARVSLGKIFSERGMLNEAVVEFEKVIASIPDNLYAHKKLAEIYKDIGEKPKAIKEFKTVLKLNPMDEWAATSLVEIEGKSELAKEEPVIREVKEKITQDPLETPEALEPTDLSVGMKTAEKESLSPEKAPEEEIEGEAVPLGEMPVMPDEVTDQAEALQESSEQPEEIDELPISEEFGRFDKFLSGQEEETETETEHEDSADLLSSDKETDLWSLESDLSEDTEIEDELRETPISKEDLNLWKSYKEAEESTTAESLDIEEQHPEEATAAEPFNIEDQHPEEATAVEPFDIDEQTPEEALSFESLLSDEEAQPVVETVPVDKQPHAQPQAPNLSDADQYIHQGKYADAIEIYQEILSHNPGNKQIIQRIEELKSLLKLLGKDKAELITKLEQFLTGIRKRRDEFFRNP